MSIQVKNKKQDKGKDNAEALIIIGVTAIAFAAKSIQRTRRELVKIEKMWAKGTTVKQLEQMAADDKALPDMVLVKGVIGSDGPPVGSICSRVESLAPLMGKIDQPDNDLVDLGKMVSSGAIKVKGINQEDLPKNETDDYSKRTADDQPYGNFVVNDLLITRLSCWAYTTKTKDKDDNEIEKHVRHARDARSMVHHSRAISQGLYLQDDVGSKAEMVVPKYDLLNKREEAPGLFLSLPDVMSEFKSYITRNAIINGSKPLTHLSKFIYIDQRSQTDDGNVFSTEGGHGTLDAIGQISPHNWLWTPKAYYDNNEPLRKWAKWQDTQLIPYTELSQRIKTAAYLNNIHQEIREKGFDMEANRDEENCFRIVELGIPSGEEVTVLASPRVIEGSDRKISFVSPDYTRSEEDKLCREFNKLAGANSGSEVALSSGGSDHVDQMLPRFRFRILRGHTISNLRKHRRLSILTYAGFGAVGLFTATEGSRQKMCREKVTTST